MSRKIAVVAALVALCPSVSVAQQGAPGRGGTEQEQAACIADVEKYCRSVLDEGNSTVLACLQANRQHISKACDKVLRDHNQ
jgi:hypothetical protein